MSRMKSVALLTLLLDGFRESGRGAGETQFECAVFLAKELAAVPFAFRFRTGRRGVESPELRRELAAMREDGLIRTCNGPFGNRLCPTERGSRILAAFPRTARGAEDDLRYISGELAELRGGDVHRLARTVAAYRRHDSLPDVERDAAVLAEVSPGMSSGDARNAIKRVRRIMSRYEMSGA